MSHLAFFLASFCWNYGLGMTYVVVPLYAVSQGLTGMEIGFYVPGAFALLWTIAIAALRRWAFAGTSKAGRT